MNKKISQRFLWIFGSIAAVLIIGFMIFEMTTPNLGFTYYEPSYLPPNVSIKARRISMNMNGGNAYVEQNFRTEDWVYEIAEYKAGSPADTANQDYNPQSVSPTCDMRVSFAKMHYRLCHWIDYGRIDVHEVKFIKGDTSLDIQIPSNLKDQISVEEIDKFVDSFHRASTNGLPVLQSNGA